MGNENIASLKDELQAREAADFKAGVARLQILGALLIDTVIPATISASSETTEPGQQ